MMEADFAAMDGDDPCPQGKGDKCSCSPEEKRKFAEQKKKDDCTEVRELLETFYELKRFVGCVLVLRENVCSSVRPSICP